mgnify:CR=1 FL=1
MYFVRAQLCQGGTQMSDHGFSESASEGSAPSGEGHALIRRRAVEWVGARKPEQIKGPQCTLLLLQTRPLDT